MSEPHTLHPILQQLLGCAWGRRVSTPDDTQPCPAQAVQIVVLHDGEDELSLRLCARHVEAIERETTPHQDT